MFRAAAALSVGLAVGSLSGCRGGDARQPFTDSRPPPGLQTRFYPPEGWAWGLVQVGESPPARYGVSAPPVRPRADVLIVAGYGEPAEVWFETAAALNARGHVVWVLEPARRAGALPFDLPWTAGETAGPGQDAAILKALARSFVRRRPLILIASPGAAPPVLAALQAGLQADAVVLIAPALDAAPAVPAAGRWKRDGPDDRALGLTHDAARGRLRLAWQTANPDLRAGGPSRAWRSAYAAEVRQVMSQPLHGIRAPVLVTVPDGGAASAQALCRRLPRCAFKAFGTAGPALQLETDATRGPWLSAVIGFIEPGIVRFAPPPAEARLAPEG